MQPLSWLWLEAQGMKKGITTYACVRKSSPPSQLDPQKETCRLKKCLPVTWINQDESLACSKVVGSTFGAPGLLNKFHSWTQWTQAWILSSWIAGAVWILYSRDRVSVFWQLMWDDSVAKEHVSCWNSSVCYQMVPLVQIHRLKAKIISYRVLYFFLGKRGERQTFDCPPGVSLVWSLVDKGDADSLYELQWQETLLSQPRGCTIPCLLWSIFSLMKCWHYYYYYVKWAFSLSNLVVFIHN